MNREIKFRAFDNRSNTVVPVWGIDYRADKNYQMVLTLHGDQEFPKWGNTKEHITLLQFTGKKDKTEKDIYEGDIVRIEKNRTTPGTGTFNYNFVVKDIRYLYDIESCISCEIIGNIYENPELLATIL